MLGVQTGGQPPLPLFEAFMDRFLLKNVWFDWDIEDTANGRVDSAQINEIAESCFARRRKRGHRASGLFAFYIYDKSQVYDPAGVRRRYEVGLVVPLFDDFGGRGPDPAGGKIARTRQIHSLFGTGPYGIMEFKSGWGSRYNQLSAREYFEAFPDTLIMASQ